MPEPLTRVGRYEIIDKLGRGGMGTLYLARDPAIERLVAIKLLRDEFDNEELRERFAREARSAGKLRHVNVVTIFDVGEDAGRPFIAMEYIPGETLAEVIRRRDPIALGRKLQMIEDVCAGLEYAHKAGIVHRDIKPANIMVDPDGVVKILDFGIARVAQSGMTQSGMLVGTLNYMSPEQVAGSPVDLRSDVFAVGAVLYELLAYQQAFPGGIQDGIFNRIMTGQPQPVSELCPSLPRDVERAIAKSLEKDPARRYGDLGQMRRDLARARQALEISAQSSDVTMPFDKVKTQGDAPRQQTSGRRILDPQIIARRAAQIEAHLTAARDHLDAGRFDEALAACEQAAILDPTDLRTIDLMDRARAALDEQRILGLVQEARTELQRGAMTAAGSLLDQARALNPDVANTGRPGTAIQQLRLEIERARERAELIRAGLERARDALAGQRFESVIRHATELLAIDPTLAEAQALRRQAQEAVDQRRREEEAQRQAAEAAVIARADFARGDRDGALKRLRAYKPPHPIVTEALEQLTREAEEIELRTRELRRIEDEQRARERAFADAIAEARRQLEAGAIDGALDLLRRLDAATPGRQEVAELMALAEEAQAAQWAVRLRAALDSQLVVARQRFNARRFNEARDIVGAILRQDTGHQGALALDAEIGAAIAAPPSDATFVRPQSSIEKPVIVDAEGPRTAPHAPPIDDSPPPRPRTDSAPRPVIMTPPPPRPREPVAPPQPAPAPSPYTPIVLIGIAVAAIGAIALAVAFWPAAGPPIDDPTTTTTSLAALTTTTSVVAPPVTTTTIREEVPQPTTSMVAPPTTTSRVATSTSTTGPDPAALAELSNARGAAAAAGAVARGLNAPVTARSAYELAASREQEAARFATAGQTQTAAREYREAADLYDKASQEARAFRAASSSSSVLVVPKTTTTVPVSIPPPTTSSTPPLTTSAVSSAPPTSVSSSVPPPPPKNDEASIRETIARYQSGYERLDPAAVKAVFPTIDARGLGDVLKQYVVLSYTVAIAGIQVSADGAQATVTATINQRGAARVGNVPPQSRSAVFRMKKTGTQWIIENVTIR